VNVAEFTEWITCKVIRNCKKYKTYTNYVFKVPPYESKFTPKFSLNTCLIWLEIRHFPNPNPTQKHAWTIAKAAITIRQTGKKFGVMKPCMWMICHRSNSWQLCILVATTFVKNWTAWHNGQETLGTVKEAEIYLLHKWGSWSVVLITNVTETCVCILYIRALG